MDQTGLIRALGSTEVVLAGGSPSLALPLGPAAPPTKAIANESREVSAAQHPHCATISLGPRSNMQLRDASSQQCPCYLPSPFDRTRATSLRPWLTAGKDVGPRP